MKASHSSCWKAAMPEPGLFRMSRLAKTGTAVALLMVLSAGFASDTTLGQGANHVEKCLMAGDAHPDAVIGEWTLAILSRDPAGVAAAYFGRAGAHVRKEGYEPEIGKAAWWGK